MEMPDPLTAACQLVTGFYAVRPLAEKELAVLYDMIAARLLITVATAAANLQAEPDNPYLQHLEAGQRVVAGEQIATVGPAPENGNWPPHLHFQIMLDMLGEQQDFPGVCYPEERATWLSLCPDPSLWFPALPVPAQAAFDASALMEKRQKLLGRSLSVSYQQPLHIVRGFGAYLYDDNARRYLDTVNNVAHVGHEHPKVVRAAQRQMALLNTNTRYLHENVVHFAEELTATLPPELSVVHFVNSGSEANELALRMAKTWSGQGDVIAVEEVDRWIMTEFPSGNQLLVAISQTADPLGAWDAYNFATPSFPDYPKYSIWNNAYSVTTNEGGAGTLHAYFINREALLNTEAMVPIQRISLPGNTNTEAGFFVATPVDWTGFDAPVGDPLIVALNDSSWGATDEDAIEIYSVNIDWDEPANTAVTNTSVVTAPYDAYACAAPGFGFACVPQLGGGGLDGIPEVIMNQAVYRNFGTHETMLMTFMTDVDGNELAGIRWVELRRTEADDWSVYQEGTWAPDDGLHRFMGSIQMDGAGNIGLAYNVSSEETYVGVRYTGRRATDPLGEMTVEEGIAVEGSGSISSGGRFGDYAHMSVDPTNDRTFWYTTEYAGTNNVRTRIISFELRKDTTDLAVRALLTPESAPDLTAMETVSMEVINAGLDTLESFSIGYSFEGSAPVIDMVTMTLLPDSTYTHTFGPTADLSVIGDYNFTLFATTEGDQQVRNDTLEAVVSHLARYDAAITDIRTGSTLLCGESFPVELELSNLGFDTLFSVTIELSLDGNALDPITWEGVLESGESINLFALITGAVDGINTLTAVTVNPNGLADQRPDNDAFEVEIDVLLAGVDVFLNLTTDEYPGETTWEITDENGPYTYSIDGGETFFDNSTFTGVAAGEYEIVFVYILFSQNDIIFTAKNEVKPTVPIKIGDSDIFTVLVAGGKNASRSGSEVAVAVIEE
eukprot:g737.t1